MQNFLCQTRWDNLATPGCAVSVMLYPLRTGVGIWDFATLSLYLFVDLEHSIVKKKRKRERENLSQEICALGAPKRKHH